MMHLTTLDLVVVTAYLAFLVWIGFHFSAKQKSREEYFLGNRRMHWLLVGGSLLATLVSTVTYLNTPGEMIQYGIGYFVSLLTIPFIVPVVNRLIVPQFAAMPMTSAYEYIEKRFSATTRTITATVFTIRTLVWMGLVIYTASFAMTAMLGWNIYLAIFVLGLSTTLYTSAGGFRTVIWTDNLQLWILLGGALVIPVVVWLSTGSGPMAWWGIFRDAGRADVELFSWDPTVRVTAAASMLNYFFWNVCTQSSDQVAVQRYLSTPSVQAARRAVWMYGFFKVVLTVCLLVCGLALFAFYARRSGLPADAFLKQVGPEADRILPQFIVQELPVGIRGLMLAALLAAAMSSLSSGINSITSVFSVDLSARIRFFRRWKGSLRMDKCVAFVAGLLGVAISAGVAALVPRTDWNLVELTGRVNMVFVGPMGALFLGGILFRRTGTVVALCGFCAATAVSVFIAFGKEILELRQSVSFLWVIPVSFLTGMFVSYLGGRLFARAPTGFEKLSNPSLR